MSKHRFIRCTLCWQLTGDYMDEKEYPDFYRYVCNHLDYPLCAYCFPVASKAIFALSTLWLEQLPPRSDRGVSFFSPGAHNV